MAKTLTLNIMEEETPIYVLREKVGWLLYKDTCPDQDNIIEIKNMLQSLSTFSTKPGEFKPSTGSRKMVANEEEIISAAEWLKKNHDLGKIIKKIKKDCIITDGKQIDNLEKVDLEKIASRKSIHDSYK